MAKHRGEYLSAKERAAVSTRLSTYIPPVSTAPAKVISNKTSGLPYVVQFTASAKAETTPNAPEVEKPRSRTKAAKPVPQTMAPPTGPASEVQAPAPAVDQKVAEPHVFPKYRPPKSSKVQAADAAVVVPAVEEAELPEPTVAVVVPSAVPAPISLAAARTNHAVPTLPTAAPKPADAPIPVQLVVVTPEASAQRVVPVLPAPAAVPPAHEFTTKEIEDIQQADTIHTLPPEEALELLPDIKPAKTVVGTKPDKEPMFTWRGQPIGGGSKRSATPKPAAKAPARQSSQIVERAEFDPAEESIDAQHWFADAMEYSLDRGASDLHVVLDPKTGTLTARMRVDGMMQEFATITGADAATIMGKFKTAAGLASAGSYIPEEALYEIDVDGETRKARVASFRNHNGGDALVLRLPPTGALRALEELGFGEDNLRLFHKLLRAANRMVLIAGPMGSGKTTTAHAALKQVTTAERTVWSVEDPVERDLPGVIQLEIDDKNGAGFESLLPVLVRSDYDTLFLGEIRDKATAAAGVRQAKAGRQVISTIHANDNVTALLRLIELAQDSPLSCMDAVRGVVSQRLMRRINREWNGIDISEKYKGRVPVHEVLIINDELTEAIMRDKPIKEIKEIAARASESTFKKDSERLIAAGITDQEEVDRVLGEGEDDE